MIREIYQELEAFITEVKEAKVEKIFYNVEHKEQEIEKKGMGVTTVLSLVTSDEEGNVFYHYNEVLVNGILKTDKEKKDVEKHIKTRIEKILGDVAEEYPCKIFRGTKLKEQNK